MPDNPAPDNPVHGDASRTAGPDPIKWFRDASPYINAHRDKTFVLGLGRAALASEHAGNIVSDIALINSLGVRLVLVVDADEYLQDVGTVAGERRVFAPDDLPACTAVIGRLRAQLEARLSVGVLNSPMHGADITVTSGNLVKARPLGIIDGVDHHHTGTVRRVASKSINALLDQGHVVLLPPLGYSPTGETFVLKGADLAMETAVALRADKLIYLVGDDGVTDTDGMLVSEIQTNEIARYQGGTHDRLLRLTGTACTRGVQRCHLISAAVDGAILKELYTRDGSGTQVILQSYEQVRAATAADVAAILALIEPLQLQGILVKRSRELIESEIDQFLVMDRDGLIVACAALYPFGDVGELACLATHPDYRDDDRGEKLLAAIEARARSGGLLRLFVLTTHTADWFAERGFEAASARDLPPDRYKAYNPTRNSRVLFKSIPA